MTFLCVITGKNFARKFAKKGGLINFYKGGDDQKGGGERKGGGMDLICSL